MKRAMNRKSSSVVILLLFACSGLIGGEAAAQSARQAASADAVVRELYRVHRDGYGPIFSGKSRRPLDKFFDRELADAIWRELTRPPSDEIGNLDFDPLYNAQDMLIRGFRVGQLTREARGAFVIVSFTNAGRPERIRFLMRRTEDGWRIQNLVYTDGSDLLRILNEVR
jgi:hypothetical protein